MSTASLSLGVLIASLPPRCFFWATHTRRDTLSDNFRKPQSRTSRTEAYFGSAHTRPIRTQQAMLYATGLAESDMGKPQVGIASVWYEVCVAVCARIRGLPVLLSLSL